MKKVGLLFGSFDPVHNGHLKLAAQAQAERGLDEVWLVLQEANGYKSRPSYFDAITRRKLLELAVADQPAFRVMDADMSDPVHTMLRSLQSFDQTNVYTIILGHDLGESFEHWADAKALRERAEVFITQRHDDLSSGVVRDRLEKHQPIDDLVPPAVADFLSA